MVGQCSVNTSLLSFLSLLQFCWLGSAEHHHPGCGGGGQSLSDHAEEIAVPCHPALLFQGRGHLDPGGGSFSGPHRIRVHLDSAVTHHREPRGDA